MSIHFHQLVFAAALLLSAAGARSQAPGNDARTEPAESTPSKEIAIAQDSPSPDDEALRQAAFEGNVSVVDAALTGGTAVDAAGQDNRTPLMLASFNGHTKVLNRLLTAGADVKLVDTFGRTALHYASTGTSVESIRLLRDHGADVNRTDGGEKWTPLMYAAAEGHIDVIELLLKAGADPTSKDVDGETALDFARNAGHHVTVERIQAVAP